MGVYINKAELLKELSVIQDRPVRSAMQIIKILPTIDLVRCKDCKHYVIHTLFGHSQGWCERLCDEFDKSLAHGAEEYDYCSYRERADT